MGFFDEAEVDVNDIPEDQFGLGKDYWPIRITGLDDPQVTKGGDKYGMMVQWHFDHPSLEGNPLLKHGFKKWLQLPVPKSHQGQIPWDPKGKDRAALVRLRQTFHNLGFSADEMAKVGPAELIGRGCMAKINISQNEAGYTQFNPYAEKPLPSGDGANEFAQNSSDSGKTAEQLLEEELNG